MNQELREKALTKMLEEMNGKHSGAIDKIHNFLCEQEDDVLFEGIMKEGRSINGALIYAASLAQRQRNGNCAVIDDSEVYEWIVDYFKSDKEPDIVLAPVRVETQATSNQKPVAEKKKEDKSTTKHQPLQVEGQLSMFDL